jgi:penicillin-binding protein 2
VHGEIPEFRRRYRYLVAVVGISFVVLLGRLWQMQAIMGEHYRQKSEDNFVQELRIPTIRGMIYDRKGRPLATNRPSYDIYVTPRFTTEAVIEKLVKELQLTPDEAEAVRQKVRSFQGRSRFSPQATIRDISRDQLARFETNKSELDGVSVVAMAHRNYLHGNLAAHLLGYMNEVTVEELGQDKSRTYQSGDLVGRYGIERRHESHLRGVPGRERIIVDARGRRKTGEEAAELLKGDHRIDPEPGHNLVLTIDIEVQRLVERSLRNYPSAAAVVLEVQTGRVLASASKPAFEPNLLTGRLSPAEATRLIQDPDRPLLDKVLRENYYPGSTYKVITAVAAIEEGLVDLDEKILCTGAHSFGRRSFRCSHAHGKMNLHQAIVESCNVYFYTLAERVGMDTLAKYALIFGLGSPTGIGINGEVGGFIPTKDWYVKRKQPFRLGFTLNSAIGQGNVKVTPLHIASLYSTIAAGGRLYLPQVVDRIETSEGTLVQGFEPRLRRVVAIRPSTIAFLQEALKGVVHEDKGTGSSARLEEIEVSGKTGTAQVSRRLEGGKTIWLPDHSWFASYAPSDAPEIAVTVLIEHGGRAAKVAAPVAAEIIGNYFKYVAPGGVHARRAPTEARRPGAPAPVSGGAPSVRELFLVGSGGVPPAPGGSP